MKATIINIGNSHGLILPVAILRQLKLSLKSNVDIEVDNGTIVIKPEPRQGWAEAAIQMNAAGDDQPLLNENGNEFDNEEWTW